MTTQALDEQEVKNFFSEFLRIYREAITKELITVADKLPLFSSVPVKTEIWMDYDNTYAAIVLSKTGSGVVMEKLKDPLMCVATANSKRFEYGEQKKFLYLFQVNSKRFPDWKPDKFAEDLIRYELVQFEKSRIN